MDTLDSIEAVFAVVDNIDDNILEEIEVAEPRNPKVYFRDVDPFRKIVLKRDFVSPKVL